MDRVGLGHLPQGARRGIAGEAFPRKLCIDTALPALTPEFVVEWRRIMQEICHDNPVWRSAFFERLRQAPIPEAFQLGALWCANMVRGSYCFPRYVAALAARVEDDLVRHGLLENAWDEAGGIHHTSRSHYWLAVRLAGVLGMGNQTIEAMPSLPGSAGYTEEHFRACATDDPLFGLGMISLIEEFTTPEFTALFQGMLRTAPAALGMTTDEFILAGGGEYFVANISDDERHRQEMPRLAARTLVVDGIDLSDGPKVRLGLRAVAEGARRSIELRSAFLSDIVHYVDRGGSLGDFLGEGSLK